MNYTQEDIVFNIIGNSLNFSIIAYGLIISRTSPLYFLVLMRMNIPFAAAVASAS